MKQIFPFMFVMLGVAATAQTDTAAAASTSVPVALDAALVNEAGAVKVAVTYKGKGAVDAKHRIWVWLFDTPDIGPGSMPIAELSIDSNGGAVTFDGIDVKRVYIAVAFDESGTMNGNAPPPSGSPIGILLSQEGTPRGVAPDEEAVSVIFDDSQRMP